MRLPHILLAVLCVSAIAAAPASADAPAASEPASTEAVPLPAPRQFVPKTEFAVNRPLTGAAIVAGALIWYGSDHWFQDTLSPTSCRVFCEDRVNPFDRIFSDALRWDDPTVPEIISDATALAGAPVLAFGGLALAAYTDGDPSLLLDDVLIVGEAAVAAGVLNRVAVLSFGRTRPRTRTALPGDPDLTHNQAHQSFYSGHTTVPFILGVTAAEVARLRGYKVAPYMWGGALLLGSVTAYMRVAGADHYPTDVLVGAAVATGIGLLVPRLHRVRRTAHLGLAPLEDGGQLQLSGRW